MPGAKLHHHFLAGVVLAAVALVLAFPLIMQPAGLLVGPQFEGRNDLTAQFLAFRAFPKQVFENAGQIPLWNPYLLEGTAWLGNPQSGMFYPLNWAFLLSGEAWLASWMLAVHLWWGGLGLYRLVRRLGRGWIAGVIGGCAYLAAPYLLAQTGEGHFNQICLVAWIPWAFFFFERLRTGDRRAMPWLAAVLAIAFFAGHVQEFYYLVLFLSLMLLFEIILPDDGSRRGQLALRWLGLGLLTAGLVAVELLPQYLCCKQAVRSGGLSLEQAGAISLGPQSFRQLGAPFALGGPKDYQGPGQFFWETLFHFGWTAWALAVLGLVANAKHRVIWRYLALGILAGLIAFGNSTPVYGWLFQVVPGFSLFRAPARGLFFCSFAVAVLAAGGADCLVRSRKTILAAAVCLIVLSLMGGEAFRNARQILAVIPADSIRQTSPITEFLAEHAGHGRVLVQQDLLTDREAWAKRIFKVHGYDPVPFTRAAIFFDALAPQRNPGEEIVGLEPACPQQYRPELVELLGVRYAVVPADAPPPKAGWTKIASGRLPRDVTLSGEPVKMLDYQILQKETFFPRAYVLGQTRPLDAGRSLSQQLATLSPRQEVLVHEDVLPAGDRQEFQPAVIREYTPNRVVVEAELTRPGYLVLTEIFAAGWTAAVDGKRSRVIPINVAFRGVPLLAGTHRVELRYNPPGFKIGAGISLMSLLILLGLFVRRETSEVRDA